MYWRLPHSVCAGRTVLQEMAACLGRLGANKVATAGSPAKAVCRKRRQQGSFEPIECGERIRIRLRGVQVERAQRFVDLWVSWTLWQALKVYEATERLQGRGQERCPSAFGPN
jgi:hypothetical protein